MALLIDGVKAAEAVYATLKEKIGQLDEQAHKQLGVAILLVGQDPSSKMYANRIVKKCHELTIHSQLFEIPDSATTDSVVDQIKALNSDTRFCGIIVQFPVPKTFDSQRIREAIAPEKDVDAAGSGNIGNFYAAIGGYVPCTPQSMHHLLKTLDLNLTGKDAVVIGRSHVVGKPMAEILLNENMTVTVCHSRTKDLSQYTKRADVIMACAGVAHLVTADMIKEGAVVIDAGINMLDGKLVGDCDISGMMEKAYAVTPVPGGVGPMTIATLIGNIMLAFSNAH